MTFQVDTTDRRKERTEGGENLKELGKETEKQKRASQVDPFRASFQMACTLHLTSRHGLPSGTCLWSQNMFQRGTRHRQRRRSRL
jgi:hypothetical protein